ERNQHRLPEDIEEDEVERQQDAGGRGLQDQHQKDELLEPWRERIDDDDCNQEEQRVEPQQEEAEAIDPEVIADAQGGNPSQRFLELQLEVADAVLEAADDRQHQHQRDDGAQDAKLLDDAADFAGRQRHQQRPGEGDHQRQRQPGHAARQGVPAHPPSLTGSYPRKAATTSTTPIAPPKVQSAWAPTRPVGMRRTSRASSRKKSATPLTAPSMTRGSTMSWRWRSRARPGRTKTRS